MLLRLDAEADGAQGVLQRLIGLLREVGNLQYVGQDVIAVVAQQRVRVEDHRADGGDEHRAQGQVVQQARLGKPPDERGQRGQDQLEVHPRRADRGPLPLVGQHPGIGDVAVQAGREHQQHHAHLVALAAKVLAHQPVAELVQHLGQGQHEHHPDHVLGGEELMEAGELRLKHVELHRDQQHGGQPQQQGRDQGRQREAPADLGIQPVEHRLGIDAAEANRQQVGQPAAPFLPGPLAAAEPELTPLAGRVGEDQPALVQHPDELLQLLDADFLRAELGLEPPLELVEAGPAIQPAEQRVFLLLEAEVLQGNRVLHDPIGPPVVAMPLEGQVGPGAEQQPPRGAGGERVGDGHHRAAPRERDYRASGGASESVVKMVTSASSPGLSSQ